MPKIDRNYMALEVTQREGKKRSVDHFQIREVQSHVLSVLAEHSDSAILELMDTIRSEDATLKENGS